MTCSVSKLAGDRAGTGLGPPSLRCHTAIPVPAAEGPSERGWQQQWPKSCHTLSLGTPQTGPWPPSQTPAPGGALTLWEEGTERAPVLTRGRSKATLGWKDGRCVSAGPGETQSDQSMCPGAPRGRPRQPSLRSVCDHGRCAEAPRGQAPAQPHQGAPLRAAVVWGPGGPLAPPPLTQFPSPSSGLSCGLATCRGQVPSFRTPQGPGPPIPAPCEATCRGARAECRFGDLCTGVLGKREATGHPTCHLHGDQIPLSPEGWETSSI